MYSGKYWFKKKNSKVDAETFLWNFWIFAWKLSPSYRTIKLCRICKHYLRSFYNTCSWLHVILSSNLNSHFYRFLCCKQYHRPGDNMDYHHWPSFTNPAVRNSETLHQQIKTFQYLPHFFFKFCILLQSYKVPSYFPS